MDHMTTIPSLGQIKCEKVHYNNINNKEWKQCDVLNPHHMHTYTQNLHLVQETDVYERVVNNGHKIILQSVYYKERK